MIPKPKKTKKKKGYIRVNKQPEYNNMLKAMPTKE